MTMTWIVLVVIAAFQLGLLRRSWTLAREDDTVAFDDLLARFLPDLVNRAKRGDAPDWLRYMDEVDRVHEGRGEKLRVNATAALVFGMGGTMVALALHLLFIEGNNQSLGSLIAAMSSALEGNV